MKVPDHLFRPDHETLLVVEAGSESILDRLQNHVELHLDVQLHGAQIRVSVIADEVHHSGVLPLKDQLVSEGFVDNHPGFAKVLDRLVKLILSVDDSGRGLTAKEHRAVSVLLDLFDFGSVEV